MPINKTFALKKAETISREDLNDPFFLAPRQPERVSKLVTRIRETGNLANILLVIEDPTSTAENAVEKILTTEEKAVFVSIEESDSLTKEEILSLPFDIGFTLSQLGPCFVKDYVEKFENLAHPLWGINAAFSTGERRIIKLLIILLSAQPGSLIIVDGLEVHLHPINQRKIAAVIANFCDYITLICTTTSMFVIQKWQGLSINVRDII